MSAKFDTGLKATKLMDVEAVLQGAQRAKGCCMGAAWIMDAVCEMIKGVRAMGMETCMTLGMLTAASGKIERSGALLQSYWFYEKSFVIGLKMPALMSARSRGRQHH